MPSKVYIVLLTRKCVCVCVYLITLNFDSFHTGIHFVWRWFCFGAHRVGSSGHGN